MPRLWSQLAFWCRTIARQLRPFRFLIVVYGTAVTVGVWEISRRDAVVDLLLDPGPNFTNTVHDLYPDRGEPQHLKAIQTLLCAESRYPIPTVCRQLEPQELKQEVKALFQRGLETGIKHDEGLYYEYIQFLVLSGGRSSEINAAYRTWHRLFPLSKLPDPRRRPR